MSKKPSKEILRLCDLIGTSLGSIDMEYISIKPTKTTMAMRKNRTPPSSLQEIVGVIKLLMSIEGIKSVKIRADKPTKFKMKKEKVKTEKPE